MVESSKPETVEDFAAKLVGEVEASFSFEDTPQAPPTPKAKGKRGRPKKEPPPPPPPPPEPLEEGALAPVFLIGGNLLFERIKVEELSIEEAETLSKATVQVLNKYGFTAVQQYGPEFALCLAVLSVGGPRFLDYLSQKKAKVKEKREEIIQ